MIFGIEFQEIRWNPCFSQECYFIHCLLEETCQTDPETILVRTKEQANQVLNEYEYRLDQKVKVYQVQWDTQNMTANIVPVTVQMRRYID